MPSRIAKRDGRCEVWRDFLFMGNLEKIARDGQVFFCFGGMDLVGGYCLGGSLEVWMRMLMRMREKLVTHEVCLYFSWLFSFRFHEKMRESEGDRDLGGG